MEQTTVGTSLAKLLFLLFVFVADADDGLTAREVDRLNDLLDNTDWTLNPAMLEGLATLRQRYPEYWRDYQKGVLQRNSDALLPAMAAAAGRVAAEEREALHGAVRAFVGAIGRNHSPILSRLGITSQPQGKVRAMEEAEALLVKLRNIASEAQAATALEAAPAAPPGPHVAQVWPAAGIAFREENVWQRGRIRLRCVAVIPETHDVKTFAFVSDPGKLHTYKPGQFMTLELPIDGRTVRRSYTISSSPSRPHIVHITVKQVPGGLVSNWLHANMTPGFEFNASGPNGHFTCFDAPGAKLLLISAGSGITPLMSMLRWLADTQSEADIVFLNNIRTPADVIFEQELRYIGTRLGARLRLGIVPGRIDPGQSWQGTVGHFSMELLKMHAPDYIEREVFVCGPAPYMEIVRKTLEEHGHPTKHYHQESFGGAPAAAGQARPPQATNPTPAPQAAAESSKLGGADAGGVAPASGQSEQSGQSGQSEQSEQSGQSVPSPQSAQSAKPPNAAQPAAANPAPAAQEAVPATVGEMEVVFSKSGKTVRCGSDDMLLDVAEANGIAMESSCRAGSCGTCKVKKLEGKVDMDGQQALSDADIEENYVLCCVGRACSAKVVLEA